MSEGFKTFRWSLVCSITTQSLKSLIVVYSAKLVSLKNAGKEITLDGKNAGKEKTLDLQT